MARRPHILIIALTITMTITITRNFTLTLVLTTPSLTPSLILTLTLPIAQTPNFRYKPLLLWGDSSGERMHRTPVTADGMLSAVPRASIARYRRNCCPPFFFLLCQPLDYKNIKGKHCCPPTTHYSITYHLSPHRSTTPPLEHAPPTTTSSKLNASYLDISC